MNSKILIVVLVTVAILIAILILGNNTKDNAIETLCEQHQDLLNENTKLKAEIKEINNHTWQTLKSEAKEIVENADMKTLRMLCTLNATKGLLVSKMARDRLHILEVVKRDD